MNAQLLLLLGLVGPFCAFTFANPTGQTFSPTSNDSEVSVTAAASNAPKIRTTLITDVLSPSQEALPAEVTTEATAELAPLTIRVNTEKPLPETGAPTVPATEAPFSDPPAGETEAPTQPAEAKIPTEGTTAAEKETGEEVVVEDGTEGGLSSGQVVGIVIGALLAVVIVVAVVIAAVRRMGKYSP